MIVLALLVSVAMFLWLAWMIVGSFVSHRHWRRVIAGGDEPALLAAVEEAIQTWQRMRLPVATPPADWAALQSASIVACDRQRCRVALIAGPDARVIGGERQIVGDASRVAARAAVRMAERLLYELPLARFDAVQVDVFAEYRSADGSVETDCLLTTQVSRVDAAVTDWDEATAETILDTWRTQRLAPPGPVDPDRGALIARAEHVGRRLDAPGQPDGATGDSDAAETGGDRDGEVTTP